MDITEQDIIDFMLENDLKNLEAFRDKDQTYCKDIWRFNNGILETYDVEDDYWDECPCSLSCVYDYNTQVEKVVSLKK